MLVLSRKVGEEIVIGDQIVVKLIKVHGSRIQIGIAAPREILVHRKELLPEREVDDDKDVSSDRVA